ncbi:aminoglycoside 3-N-acetyltransferase [Geomicrobium halophilum]|uniref:Aminoglycoside N(3)-acetyltransferase n=1 Tax=Geomicrobium halophilum TaxID=549000 RepID=A0A841PNY8_9BACL|nr:AAC(3) family N-acetyltransferase [Geomicrobium halophilum]MBB6450547.1 aminoglycoside 3-N-acetyltransferase [Geomicrobium halophilum]
MSEEKVIQASLSPQTRTSLSNSLIDLGLKEGMIVIVHSSMSALGWVCGGPVAVIQSIQDVITANGTLVMPTHSANVSDPKEWGNPSIPKSWVTTVREEMPAFDPNITPTLAMGSVAETFRSFPDVKRSYHPVHSFAAWGKHRDTIIDHHSLKNGLGENSPLASIYELGGHVLMLGTEYDTNTSMHLGEHRSGVIDTFTRASPIFENGKKVWRTYSEIDYDEEAFPNIGEGFESKHTISVRKIGTSKTTLLFQPDLVDYTAKFLREQVSMNKCNK